MYFVKFQVWSSWHIERREKQIIGTQKQEQDKSKTRYYGNIPIISQYRVPFQVSSS